MARGKRNSKPVEEVVKEVIEPVEEIEETTESNEIVEENIEPEIIEEKIIKGTVLCDKLNVRKEAKKDAAVLTIIPKDLILTISDVDASPDFYKVLIGEVEGYCMKKFIAILAE